MAPPATQDVLYKVRLAVSKRKVRLHDNFEDFDRLHHGDVSQEQAKRVLTIAGIYPHLTEADFSYLLEHYPGHGPATFRYFDFLRDVSLEEVPANADIVAQARSKIGSDKEDEQMARAMKGFVHTVIARSLDVSVPFQDFDRHNIGKVSETQFERAFPFATEQGILSRIIRKYRDGNGHVNYKGWVEEVRSAVAATSASAGSTTANPAHHSPTHRHHPLVGSVADILSELRGQFRRHRIRIDDPIRDFDKTHAGSITEGQFRGALGATKLVHFVLTEEHMELLVQHYALPSEAVQAERRVDYRRFLRDVSDIDAPVSPLSSHSTLTGTEEEGLRKVLEKIRSTVHTRRMNLKPTFQDFDRAAKGIYQCRTCTHTRFQRALALNKINLAPAEIALLEKKYSVTLPGETESDAVDYVSFCRDVEMEDLVKPVISQTHAAHPNPAAPPVGAEATNSMGAQRSAVATLDSTLDNIAQQMALRRMRPKDFFQDFDPLRSGSVPEEKFGTALSMSSIRVSNEELALLLKQYAHPQLPHYSIYSTFLAEVERRSNAMEPQGTVYSQPSAKNNEDIAKLKEIHERIAKTVKGRGILLPPFFQDYDRHHCGRITAVQFSQTISRHQFPVSTAEVELLCQHYSCADDPVMVQYRPFLGAIDESEDILSQHARRLASRPTEAHAARATGGHPTQAQGSDGLEGVMAKIKVALLRGVRLNEFFRDIDTLRKGYIPSGKFLSAIDMCGCHVTDVEAAALVARYANPSVVDTVNYVSFIRDVEAVNESLSAARSNSPHTSPRRDQGQPFPDAPPAFQSIVNRIREHRLRTRRATTIDGFHDFDKLRKGRVTVEQFHAVMTMLGVKLSAAEVSCLNSALSLGRGELGYVEFSRAVDA